MSTCEKQNLHAELIGLYTKLAEQPDAEFGWHKGKANARQLGYSEAWLERLPEVVWESAAAVGNPFKLGDILPGQTILDAGCGAGADACIAALLTGDTGMVIGVDCTPAMIDKARGNARQAALENIRFHVADMTTLPVADNTVDLVISNGAVNLAVDKDRVFRELYRVLKPGGRLQIADMIRVPGACPGPIHGSESWSDCVQGTLPADGLLAVIANAGFADVMLVEMTGYKTSESTNGALVSALRL